MIPFGRYSNRCFIFTSAHGLLYVTCLGRSTLLHLFNHILGKKTIMIMRSTGTLELCRAGHAFCTLPAKPFFHVLYFSVLEVKIFVEHAKHVAGI